MLLCMSSTGSRLNNWSSSPSLTLHRDIFVLRSAHFKLLTEIEINYSRLNAVWRLIDTHDLISIYKVQNFKHPKRYNHTCKSARNRRTRNKLCGTRSECSDSAARDRVRHERQTADVTRGVDTRKRFPFKRRDRDILPKFTFPEQFAPIDQSVSTKKSCRAGGRDETLSGDENLAAARRSQNFCCRLFLASIASMIGCRFAW